MNDFERDQLRRLILKLIADGYNHWTIIEKRACGSGFGFATSNTVKRQFYDYLVAWGYVARVRRGKYVLTKKGQLLLVLLS